jgi:hypothetical protein
METYYKSTDILPSKFKEYFKFDMKKNLIIFIIVFIISFLILNLINTSLLSSLSLNGLNCDNILNVKEEEYSPLTDDEKQIISTYLVKYYNIKIGSS